MTGFVPLKRVARIRYGLGQPPPLSEEGIPIIRATNVFRGKISANNLLHARLEDLPLGRAPLLHEGEILVVRSGAYTGDSARITSEWVGSAPGYDLRVTPQAVDSRFVAYALLTRSTLDQIKLASTRAAQPHLNAEELGEVELWLPPLEEQRRIADFLDAETIRIDAMRSCSQRQAELLGLRFKELMRQETTVGQGPATETGIPWMPRMHHEWKLHKVSQEFRTSSGTTPTSSDSSYFDGPYPWVNSADVRDDLISRAEKSVTQKALLDFPALKVHPAGALVVALYGQGATKGRVGILEVDSCLNQACCALVPTGRISTEFAYYWFRAHKDGIVTQAVGAGQPNLSQELVRQLRIPAPSAEMQLQIASRLRESEKSARVQVSQLERRDALLTERRQALITAAVTGQFDVSTASGRNVTDGVSA
ncbi:MULTISPECIES: restriction endonuclease subunit S [Streptomyces]|uniref:Restriction endonuclease subunit S n=1 Tax=Streptomyces sudanensis TaxID=436397 RepID=A0ABY4T8K9_9ACTN|nr:MULTISPECIES: restriction endonuclease subunit S [Streptomyces]URN15037.1 restriction endonuclease subunit S [Streptomyces sudanensis]